jgi:hypothetical protein
VSYVHSREACLLCCFLWAEYRGSLKCLPLKIRIKVCAGQVLSISIMLNIWGVSVVKV